MEGYQGKSPPASPRISSGRRSTVRQSGLSVPPQSGAPVRMSGPVPGMEKALRTKNRITICNDDQAAMVHQITADCPSRVVEESDRDPPSACRTCEKELHS